MNRTFKIFSVMLSVILLMQLSVPVLYAAELNNRNELVLLDQYSTDRYEMIAYQEGDIFYVITITSDEQIEIASAKTGHVASSIWLDMQDIPLSSQTMMIVNDVSNLSFAEAVIEYGNQHKQQEKTAGVELIRRTEHVETITLMTRCGETTKSEG